MEQLIYSLYKITNSVDDMIYIGSTRLKLTKRFNVHKYYARKNDTRKFSQHMIKVGIDNFKIELIETITVATTNEARIREQLEIDKCDKTKLLNTHDSINKNPNRTGSPHKLITRKKYYQKKKLDLEWCEKEKERNKLKMREKRKLLKENRQEAVSETERE
jgi:group I intron endonuclease